MYSAQAVANVFIEIAKKKKEKLNRLQLQRIVYIAHGLMLAYHDRPLYWNVTEAGPHGPRIPELYWDLFNHAGSKVNKKIPAKDVVPEDSVEAKMIADVYDFYGQMDFMEMSAVTHRAQTPWGIARANGWDVIVDDLTEMRYKDWFVPERAAAKYAEVAARGRKTKAAR